MIHIGPRQFCICVIGCVLALSQHFVLVCSLSSGMLRMIQRNGEASVAAERFELQDALQGKQGGLITAGISWDALMGGLCEGYV